MVCFLSLLLSEKGPEFPSPFFSLSTSGSFCLFVSPTLKIYLLTFVLIFLYEDLTCLLIHKQLPRRLDELVSAQGSSRCLSSTPGALKTEAAQTRPLSTAWQVPREWGISSLYSQKRIQGKAIIFHLELYNKECCISRKQLQTGEDVKSSPSRQNMSQKPGTKAKALVS